MTHDKYGVRVNETRRLGSSEVTVLGFYQIVTGTGPHDASQQFTAAMARAGWDETELGTVDVTNLHQIGQGKVKSVRDFVHSCESAGLIRVELLPKQTITKRRERV